MNGTKVLIFSLGLFVFAGCGKVNVTKSPASTQSVSNISFIANVVSTNLLYILQRDNFADMLFTTAKDTISTGGGTYRWSGASIRLFSSDVGYGSTPIVQCSPYAYANTHYVAPNQCNAGAATVNFGIIGYTIAPDAAGKCPGSTRMLYMGTNSVSNWVSYDRSELEMGQWGSISAIGCAP